MRSLGKDIVELFGFASDDVSSEAISYYERSTCPFVGITCTKNNHDRSLVYGVCSVTNGMKRGEHQEVIVCPNRLYENNYAIFQRVLDEVWSAGTDLIVGGSLSDLRKKALQASRPVVAFGQNSGAEIAVRSNGDMSMDWVLQKYDVQGQALIPDQFVGVEVQSIDITGNYRDNWLAYREQKLQPSLAQKNSYMVPASGHGLNWANVHKRLIPQIIRKGNLYRRSKRCAGFYFLVPEIVYRVFEEVIGKIPEQQGPSRDNISIHTYSLGDTLAAGNPRSLKFVRSVHLDLQAVALSFINNYSEQAPEELDRRLRSLL